MIKLSNITLSFGDHKLIEKGNVVIPNGLVTLVKGESGCGKSTLLMSVGLLSQQTCMGYTFNNMNMNEADEKTLSLIRKNEISFIFQETYLFEHLNLIENIQFYANLSYQNVEEDYIRQQLDFVGLDLDFHTQISSMSGGEKQRLAIVCGIMKDAKLFIFDEPTSYLDDDKKQIIISIIKKLAHDKNKMVIIASHDENLISIADLIYEFRNREIICAQNIEYKKDDDEFKHEPMNLKVLYRYIFKKNIFSASIMSIILGIILAGFTISYIYGSFYKNHDEQAILSAIHHEVYIMKSDETMMSVMDQVKLQDIFRDYQLYPSIHLTSNIQLNNKTLDNVYLKPYFPQSIDNVHILKSYHDKTFDSVYATYEIYHDFKEEIMDNVILNNTSYQISGVLKPGYDTNSVLYLPYDSYKDILKNQEVDLENIPVENVVLNIESLDDYRFISQNIDVNYRFETLINIESQVNLLSFFTSEYLIIIWVITFIIFVVYKTYRVIDDKKNIALLKTLGVNSQLLLKLKMIEECMTLLPMSVVAMILSWIGIYILSIHISMLMIGIIYINVFFIFIINIMIYYIFIRKYSAASLFRSN